MDSLAGALSTTDVANPPPFPTSTYLQSLETNPNLVPHDFLEDFPLLKDDSLKRVWGTKGKPFSRCLGFRMFWNESTKKLEGVIYFPRDTEGPPGAVHGGCIATALDSALGTFVLRLAGFGCVTLNLNTNYRKFVPIDSCARVECWALEQDQKNPRKIFVASKLTPLDSPADTLSEATAIFYKRSPEIPGYQECLRTFGRTSGITKEGFLRLLKSQKQQPPPPPSKEKETDTKAKL